MISSAKAECPDKYTLFQYFNGDLNVRDVQITKEHLAECSDCLLRIQEFALIQSRLDAVPDLEVPKELAGKVRTGWKTAGDNPSVKKNGEIGRLVVQFAKSGFRVLKESILPDDTEIIWRQLGESAFVFRDTKQNEVALELLLQQEIRKQDTVLSLSFIREPNESVQMRVHLKESDRSLPDTRVSLKRSGSILHSKKTDPEGSAIFTHIDPGTYTVEISSRKIQWTIEFRP